MTSPMRRALVLFLATTIVGLGVVSLAVRQLWLYPDRLGGAATGPVEFEVPRGVDAGEVAQLLVGAGLLERPTLFRLYAAQRGAASRFKAGHYKVQAPATPRQLLEIMLKGAADELISVTIPEGKNLVEIAALLEAAGVTSKAELLAQAADPAFLRSLDLSGPSLEGYLFPDTYKLRPNSRAARVLVPLLRRHRQVFEELRAAHPRGPALLKKSLGFDDARIVTLASIVEKETGQQAERPRIAQVFLNRLSKPTFKPKLLQTDPTIIYGCTAVPLLGGKSSAACRQWDGRIRRIHLDDPDNTYNTYTHEGLPPGPIANPGRAALAAVMNPDGSPFLYFVAKNDGTHFFSATQAEHEAAVVKYQRGGKPMSKAAP